MNLDSTRMCIILGTLLVLKMRLSGENTLIRINTRKKPYKNM
jgi:hypothetical protein